MAQHKSAKKRARQNIKRNLANRSYLSQVKTAVKGFMTALENKSSQEDVMKLFQSAQSLLQKAATKGVIHRNNASRKVRSLAALAKKNAGKA